MPVELVKSVVIAVPWIHLAAMIIGVPIVAAYVTKHRMKEKAPRPWEKPSEGAILSYIGFIAVIFLFVLGAHKKFLNTMDGPLTQGTASLLHAELNVPLLEQNPRWHQVEWQYLIRPDPPQTVTWMFQRTTPRRADKPQQLSWKKSEDNLSGPVYWFGDRGPVYQGEKFSIVNHLGCWWSHTWHALLAAIAAFPLLVSICSRYLLDPNRYVDDQFPEPVDDEWQW